MTTPPPGPPPWQQPQPPAGQPYTGQPAPQPKRRRKWPWIVAAVALLGFGGCTAAVIGAANEVTKDPGGSTSTSGAPVLAPGGVADDVKITSCEVDDLGYGVATLRVTNNSSKPSNYIITVAFENTAGDQEGTANAVVQTLQPGQATTTKAQGLDPVKEGGRCVVTDVTRLAS